MPVAQQPANNSPTYWLAVYIVNDDIQNATKLVGSGDVDHDEALLQVINFDTIIYDNGLNIVNRIVNGYLIKDVASVIRACVLHGNMPILGILIAKYTTINKDWFYYAWEQLISNSFAAQRPQNTARWILNYAAENKINLQTSEIMSILTNDKELTHTVLDCLFDNPEHYKLVTSKLFTVPVCELSGIVVKYLYDRKMRKYTYSEYAAATLRSHLAGLSCI
ncbi:hypothetical protein F-liban_402 [Faustovirus]|nr:hypothetical protein F-liban_402 [Faustovirus]SME65092.1 Hypothetical protein FSTVST1_392 [Faustovirus ST1]